MTNRKLPATLFRHTKSELRLDEFCADLIDEEDNLHKYCAVVSITHYKNTDAFGHEFLVLSVRITYPPPRRGTHRHIRIERFRDSSPSDTKDIV
jgi:hypothetical protein